MLAERARGQALAANRRGAYDEAQHILHEAARALHVLGAGSAAVEAVMAQLQHEQVHYRGSDEPGGHEAAAFPVVLHLGVAGFRWQGQAEGHCVVTVSLARA